MIEVLIMLAILALIPLCVYISVKLGTFAFYRARFLARRMNRREQNTEEREKSL